MNPYTFQYAISRLLTVPVNGPVTGQEHERVITALDILRLHYGGDNDGRSVSRILRVENIGQDWIEQFLGDEELDQPRHREGTRQTFLVDGWFEACAKGSLTEKQREKK